MTRALFVSPHLDDVAFSCGGTLASLAAQGWHTTLLTCFTATVPAPQGFALACQTDKGLSADVDYMALRRAEDERAAERLHVAELLHLPLPEAPHRGYESAEQLFGPRRPDDEVWREIELPDADLVFAPQARGDHVDHHQAVRAVAAAGFPVVLAYADLPYALTDGPPPPRLDAKLDACAAYTTQLGFQFGDEAGMRRKLGRAPERFRAA